jgi:hypothetical protein
VKTDKPCECATVNWKVCKSAIALYLTVIKRTCNRTANKSKHPNYNPLFLSRLPSLHVIIYNQSTLRNRVPLNLCKQHYGRNNPGGILLHFSHVSEHWKHV